MRILNIEEQQDLALSRKDASDLLGYGIATSQVDMVTKAIESGYITEEAFDYAFTEAIKQSSPEVVEVFLQYGANQAEHKDYGYAPIIALISRIADNPRNQDDKGNNISVSKDEMDIYELFFKYGGVPITEKDIMDAISTPAFLPYILDNVEDPSNMDAALSESVIRGLSASAKLLIERGANPNIEVKGRPLLLLAVAKQDPETVKLLLDAGAKANHLDSISLLAAISKGNVDIVKILLDAGADPNVDDGEPLNMAVSLDNEELVNLLYQYGAKQ